MKIRLNKYLAECGIASRRKSDELITEGRVTVNNKTVCELGVMIDPDKDAVKVDGSRIRTKSKIYFLMNKPKGVITSTKDEKDRITVIELIKSKQKIFPVGRLDYNTTGVLLLTNDGDFSNYLTHPSNKITREYEVLLDKELADEDKERLLKGIFIEGKKGRFTSIRFINKKSRKRVVASSVEGRNHFVKNMFNTLGYTVKKLDRINFGGFTCDGLQHGTYRELRQSEIEVTTGYKFN